jgi:hypothetical protein
MKPTPRIKATISSFLNMKDTVAGFGDQALHMVGAGFRRRSVSGGRQQSVCGPTRHDPARRVDCWALTQRRASVRSGAHPGAEVLGTGLNPTSNRSNRAEAPAAASTASSAPGPSM